MNECLKLFRGGRGVLSALSAAKEAEKKNEDITVNGATPTGGILFTSLSFVDSPRTLFYIAPTLFQANRAYESFSALLQSDVVALYAADEIVATHLIGRGSELEIERLHVMKDLLEGKTRLIVTHASALSAYVVPPTEMKKRIIKLSCNQRIERDELIASFVEGGYQASKLTRETGFFSVRGEVIDIWPLFMDRPVRIDTFDDTIELIAPFDPLTQRRDRSASLAKVEIFPLHEVVYGKRELARSEIVNLSTDPATADDSVQLSMHLHNERMGKYIPLLYGEKDTILSYAPSAQAIHAAYAEEINAQAESSRLVSEYLESLPHPAHAVWSFPSEMPLATSNVFLSPQDGANSLETIPVIDYAPDLRRLITDIKNIQRTRVFIFEKKERLDMLKALFESAGLKLLKYKGPIAPKASSRSYALLSSSAIPFALDGELEVLTESECFRDTRTKKAKYWSVYQASRPIASKEDLAVGDYVVHEDYGIARYEGLKSVTIGGVTNDYLVLSFKDMSLYLPVAGIGKLELYRAREGTIPALTSLQSGEWEKKKARVRARLESISREIIQLEAKRAALSGYRYPPHDAFDDMFAADFGHEETKDQHQAIQEVLSDLMEGKVMDRLICGDAGYGKTEVALRASFKVCCSHKQVALLAPTTILARQHYETFKARFEKYGLKVALLSRLTPPKEQKEALRALSSGELDCLIGTHRILSADVSFHDLGLLVVDEEQRFGVTHKEKIKRLKENVNVLSLSATPIPRTLELSIMGLRSMSLITTPPRDRCPVQTYVLDYSALVVKEAIYRELGRGGQVFYLHNRIEDLEKTRSRLQALCPEARIAIAHGQMNQGEMEDAVSAFLDGAYNVLLCTTIIENGIDMPNVNTIIIENAASLGLAQLYQLRGRVGRSDRIAYAFLFMMPDHTVTETGEKRLAAIKEFSSLGGGYGLSVRDLAIRGAGDILGREQSGFIETVGMDLYLRLLDEAVHQKKPAKKENEVNYPFAVSRHVEEDYAGNDEMIIEIHRLISSIKTKNDYEQVKSDIADRFGKASPSLSAYVESAYLAALFRAAGIERYVENATLVMVDIPHPEAIRHAIMDYAKVARTLLLNYDLRWQRGHVIIRITKKEGDQSWIHDLVTYLETLGVVAGKTKA